MKRLNRSVTTLRRLVSILGLGLALVTLQGCAGFDMSKVDFSGLQSSGMFSDSTPNYQRQQAQQYDCESRPVYVLGEYVRTDTVCR